MNQQMQQGSRPIPRPYEQFAAIANRPRPRESEPPMLSNDPEFERPAKDYSFQPKLYKPYESKLGGTGYGLEQTRGLVPQQMFDYVKGEEYPRSQISPKTDPSDWRYGSGSSGGSVGINISGFTPGNPASNPNNRSMPLASSGSKIDKLAYLKCNEQIKSTDYQQYETPDYPLKSPIQPNPSRKAPRMSEPGFPTTLDLDYPGMPSAPNQSPIRDNRADGRFMHYEAEVFKKQKDTNGSTANSNYPSSLQPFKNSLRRSEFRASDFVKGKELGSGKFGTVEVVK